MSAYRIKQQRSGYYAGLRQAKRVIKRHLRKLETGELIARQAKETSIAVESSYNEAIKALKSSTFMGRILFLLIQILNIWKITNLLTLCRVFLDPLAL